MFNGNGIYTLPEPQTPFIPGTTIEARPMNEALADIAEALSTTLLRNGEAALEADLNVGGYKLRNVATPTAEGDAANKIFVTNSVVTGFSSRVAYLGEFTTPPLLRPDGQALLEGDRYFDLASQQDKAYRNGQWVSIDPSSVNGIAGRWRYVASAGQTLFSGEDSLGRTMYYEGYIQVYKNGVKLDELAFTTPSPYSVGVAVPCSLGDVISILCYGTFSLAVQSRVTYAASEGQVTFTDFGFVIDPGNEWVFVNGVKLPPTAYTITTDTLTLLQSCTAGDEVELFNFRASIETFNCGEWL